MEHTFAVVQIRKLVINTFLCCRVAFPQASEAAVAFNRAQVGAVTQLLVGQSLNVAELVVYGMMSR